MTPHGWLITYREGPRPARTRAFLVGSREAAERWCRIRNAGLPLGATWALGMPLTEAECVQAFRAGWPEVYG